MAVEAGQGAEQTTPAKGKKRRRSRVLVVDDEENVRHMLALLLERAGYAVDTAESGSEALERVQQAAAPPALVLSDIRMPGLDGISLLRELQKLELPPPVVLMSAYGDIDTAIEGLKLGARDYVPKQPFNRDEILLRVRMAQERERLARENLALRQEVEGRWSLDNIVSGDPQMAKVFETARKVAAFPSTVLLLGESGTGKELLARALHAHSGRSGPFVAVNCGAIPEALLESELFGHVRGAFTGATSDHVGRFEEADGGTLLLDEIGDMPQQLQVKLLRVLQESEVRRLGDKADVSVDVRVLAATSRDLPKAVEEGAFREDLYYRLCVVTLTLPPLRERPDDVKLLCDHFVERFNARLGTRCKGVAPDAMRALLRYAWPGNVRELENVIERGIILSDGDRLAAADLPIRVSEGAKGRQQLLGDDELSIKKGSRLLEEDLIRKALRRTRCNRTRAAELLEISHRALLYKIKEFGIDADDP